MHRATLQAKIAALTPEQKEQLKQLLAAKREAEAKRAAIAPASKEASIPRVPEADDYALSFAQQRLWMQDELSEGGSAAYNVPLAVILRGELDVAALERAFRRLMERHAVLRTRFIRRNGEPRQVIESAPAWAIERWPEGERAAARGEFQRRAEAMANRPFALERELPFRAAAMPLAPQEHGLALVFHHIACDGRSVALLAGELERAYAEARQPEAAAVASANFRYVDFAGWHRGWMESPAGAKAKDFWVRQFAEVPEPLELPADRPRPALQDFSGGHLQRKLPPGTRERLTALGQRVGASLYGMLLAGVATFLHRYAGRNDITVGSPVEGRPRAEFDGIVGFFVNTLPLRTKLAPTDSFLAVVERVRDGVLEALEHQGCPFEVMVQSLPLERDLSRPPLFTVMMGLTRAQEEALRLPGIETEVVPLGLRTSKVDLTFHFVETAGGVELDLEYATALFDVSRVQRLAECFETMLAAALAMPAGVIGDLSLLTEAQARAWLKAANPPDAAYPCDPSLASLFREQVVRNPDAEAVAHDGRTFTYAELDRMSDAVAGHLVGCLGALRTDEPIALQVDRSERMLAALLGILKAGGCYLPINPGTPLERVRTLLKLAGVRLRLVEGEPAVPDWSGVDVDLRAWCAKPPPVTASSGVGEGPGAGLRLAYIIFTSGSTGEPKGVLIEQHSVVRLVRNTDYLQLGPGDRVLQTGSLAFDASTFEIWGPLLNGGCCCLPRGKEILEIDQFGALVRATGATTCFLTTGLFNQIANFNPEAFRELKHVLTGGEKVSAPHVNRVLAAAPGLTLLHVYGPTENTTFSTWYRVRGECRHDVPIGRPLAHSTIYILDERGNVQPPGVVGEIYCGGEGIARGYLARPEATAERFVPDPFSGRPGTRLYRTGDFGRWDEAGNVEFAGRRDDQVKIRGFRIELGEVELRLRAQPAVQQAVVVARPAGGTHELVAYLVAPGLESEETLRAGLAKVLPDYMVPSYFVLLDALPLNASGKVNRKALPAPKPAQTETSGLAASFTDPKEQALAAAWSEVLGRPPAGADAHYFNSGGDSIKAIQMTARLRARGYRLTLREVFGRPRFTDLAAGLVADAATDVDATSATAEVPFTPIQRWFLETYSPPYDHFNQATLLEAGERLRPDLLRQAVEQLVARHGMLRCRLERSDANGGWRQTIPAGPGTIGWREEDLSSRSSGEAEAAYDAATARLQRGLSLAEGRLVAAGFFRLTSSDRVLLLIHHWAVDGLSWRILVDELETIYRGLAAGDAQPKLAAPGVFRAWAQSLAAYGKSEALAQEARYWQAIADRMPHVDPAPALPATERRETVFSAELTQRLLTDAHRAYGTRVDELLLAAFGKAWADAGGPEPLALAMEGHGRESCVGPVDVSATVGWCTSMWPFVLAGGGEWPERIRAVKDALRTVPERGVGYGVLRHLQGALPAVMPRVSFNYLGVFEASRGALFRGVVDVTTGETVAAHLASPFDLDVVGEVNGGCLRVSFHFHRSAQTADQRTELVTAFGRALEAAVAEGSGGTPRRSLADFTGGVANRAELDLLLQHCAERRLEVEDILPLTPMQEGMVFHALYEPQSAAYSDQVVLRLRGPLDAPTFEAAWQALGRQYPNLRASFLTTETERPVSVIAPGTPLGFAWREASDGAELAALRAEERARKFDLQKGPLLRLTLVKLGSDEHEAILAFHHSILDGWSSGLIWQRLEENYRAVAAGRPMPAVRGAFRDFLRWLRGRDSQSDLAYWKTLLAGAAGVGVPTGAPRLGAPAVRTRSCSWEMGRERTERFVMAARRLGTTENSLFQTLWGIFLGKLTRRNDVTFGATVSGRAEGVARVDEIVGLLINTIPVRVAWWGETTFQELAERLRLQSADSMERISVSLAEIQGAMDAAASLVQHTLVFENYPAADEAGALWRTETVEVHDPMHFEFGLLVVPKRDGWTCRVVADEARYPDAYLNALQLAWHEVVDHYLAAPEGAIEGWEPKVAAGGRLRRIAVAATFTAEPIEEPLRFWLHSRGDEAQVQFAPFNQVLQQLLDPGSDLLRIRAEFNVLLVRLEDWAGSKRTDAALVEESLDLNSDLFVDGLQRLVDAAPSARSLVIFCPPSVETRGVAGLSETLAAAERRLRRRIDGPRLATVRAVAAPELLGRFRDVCADNVAGEALGGVPYAEEFFAVLACEVVRRWDAQTRAPFKVLALDADQTLWQGVLGEDGVSGIALTQGHRRLQDVAKTARAGGMLLVLVTKNNLEDVKEAFRVRGEMPLRWDDFVAVQANWRPKSESLRTLARELRLGLDSFVFLDDSGVECAEVRAALPEVLTLQVPADGGAIERFAEHLWPADVFAASAEDQQRSELYQTESRREAVRAASGGLRNFVRQLQLAIEVVAIGEANLERAAQLTQRTNQFNASTVRRPAAEIRDFLERAGHGGFLLEVKDRFGDYGLTGLILFRDEGDSRVVDTFLLSCRVLGRGVEHELLRRLGREAAARRLTTLRVNFAATAKNAPAEQFLRACAGREERDATGVKAFVFDAATASAVEIAEAVSELRADDRPAGREAPAATRGAAAHFYQTVATDLSSARGLVAAAQAIAQRSRQRRTSAAYEAPCDGDERRIAEIWAAVLGVERVGRQDDFFALGGHSLKAVMMLSRVNRALGRELLLEAIFERPVLAEFAAHVGANAGPPSGPAEITRAPDAADYPLSHAQRRLWLIEQMRTEPPSPFHMAAVFSLRGALDEARLAAAFRRVIERHESLRTGLVLVGSEPRQRVSACADFSLERLDGGDVTEFIEREFDLARPPLLRAGLCREDGQGWTLVVVMHHAVSDGWSIGVMAEELSAFYRDPAFAPVPLGIHYRDYTVWQERQLAQGAWRRASDYWRQLFRDLPAPLELPADRVRPAIKQSRGAEVQATLPAAAWADVKAAAQRAGASPFGVVLAALQVLLARHARTSRFVIGTPVAGRDAPELESQIGFFVNLLPLVAEVDGARSFHEHLAAVKDSVARALSHAAYPFDRLVNDLALPREMSRSPLFDVLLVFQSNREAELSLGDVALATVQRPSRTSQYELTFEVVETPQGLRLRLEYATSLFDAARMQRMARQLMGLLANAFANPTQAVAALELCPPEERERIRGFERGGRFGTLRSRTIPQLVREAAADDPSRVAVAVGARTITYAELEDRTRVVAAAVHAAGAAAQELIAVAGDRCEDFICALLGVMRAGCVYVPLDLKHPDERLRLVVEDGGMRRGIAIGAEAERRMQGLGLELIDPDDGEGRPKVRGETVHADELAYVIFTSGSTGRPKGVEITHASFATMIASQVRTFGVRSDDRCAWWASCAFDASLSEIFLGLTTGATVVIAEAAEREDPVAFLEWLRRLQVTVITLPPAFLRVLQREPLASVRVLITAGEAADAGDLLHYARDIETFNAYGPTETSVCATIQRVEGGVACDRTIPIGRPLDVAAAYVLDANRRRVPLGVPGELFVGGRIVGRGYRGAAELTAERFLPDPFGETPGARMYRTGDLVRWREDGALEFLGREDDQVKIRGFRIELGEVESALRAIAGVRAAAVLALERLGTKALVAYVVGEALGADALRAAITERLPDYMRPSAYCLLERLPTTPNGKLDKAALPHPDWSGSGIVTAPDNERERVLARAWTAALGIERIGQESHFFTLGGDSIKALTLAASLRAAGWQLSLKSIFAHPVLSEQARQMRAAAKRQAREVSGAVALLPIQKWFLESHRGAPLQHFNQALFYRAAERIDVARLQRAVQAVWVRHAGLRAVFAQRLGDWAQFVQPASAPAPVVQTLDVSGEADARLAIAAWVKRMQSGFELAVGPLVRYGVVHEAAGDRVLCVTHHLVSDWVSHRLLLEDLEAAYLATGGGVSMLQSAVTELDEWMQAGAAWAAHDSARQDLIEAWRGIAHAAARAALGRRAESTGCFGEVCVLARKLDVALTEALRGAVAVRGSGALRDVVLAGMAAAEKEVFGRDRLAVQLEGHGRSGWGENLDVSRTVGWFTSLYPCVLEHRVNESETQAIARVGAALAALPDAGATYGLLRAYGPATARSGELAVPTSIGFNYLGEFVASAGTGMFRIDDVLPAGAIADDFPRDHPRDVTAWIFGGQLHVQCAFLPAADRDRAMERWIDHVMAFLLAIARS